MHIECDAFAPLGALIGEARFVAWREQTRLTKTGEVIVGDHDEPAVTKIPYHPTRDAAASTTDPTTWGTLVDNLHVVPGMKGRGIGRTLLKAAASETMGRFPDDGVYLYVFELNHAARRFYASIGGREVERGSVEPPGGGSQIHWRVAWGDAGQLLACLDKENR